MKKFTIVFLIIIVVCGLLGIFYWILFLNNKDTVYKGTYKNKPVVVKLITHEGFIKNTISYTVQLGDLKPIEIDFNTTDTQGVPYDNSIFDSTKSIFIDTSYRYENELAHDVFNIVTMLYISKTNFTLKEYLAYEDFFKNNWLTVQQELLNLKNGFFTHIVGVVYGDKQDFVKVFRGTYESKFFNLTITPDGEINLNMESNSMMLQNSGLSNKVQMPGKIILKKLDGIDTAPNYDTFKDKNEKVLKDYFTIEIEKAILTK